MKHIAMVLLLLATWISTGHTDQCRWHCSPPQPGFYLDQCRSHCSSPQPGFYLDKGEHSVGTRVVSPCTETGGRTTNQPMIRADGAILYDLYESSRSECYRERVIDEWSPSGKFVNLRHAKDKPGKGDWYRTSDLLFLEVLSARPSE